MAKIVIAGVVNAHVAVKFIYVRVFRGTSSNAMHTKSLMARSLWAFICAILWIFAWMIAESIPVFNDILGLAVRRMILTWQCHPCNMLTDITELLVCKLVLLQPAWCLLASFKPGPLVHRLEAKTAV